MTRISKSWTAAAIALAAMAGFAVGGAQAQTSKIVAGTLTCSSEGGVGLILGSKQTLICDYKAANGASQRYDGTITKYGLDLGVKGASVLIWTVLGSTTEMPSGALAGTYGGVSADVAVGIGAGVNALVGGSENSVVLQPISVQGEQGLNIAAGVSELRLISSE